MSVPRDARADRRRPGAPLPWWCRPDVVRSPTFSSTTPTLGLVERANAGGWRGEETAAAKVGALLRALMVSRNAAGVWKGVEQVWFVAGDVRPCSRSPRPRLTSPSRPSSQPNPVHSHRRSPLRSSGSPGSVEQALTQAAPGTVRIPVVDGERPVLEFMHTQVRIRVRPARAHAAPLSRLQVREDHQSRLRTVDGTQPQAALARERGRGDDRSSGGVRPFVVVGALFQLKHLDPSYTCPRCQAMQADEALSAPAQRPCCEGVRSAITTSSDR